MLDLCYMTGEQTRAFIQLGRFGDLILLLPAWYRMWQLTGRKPVVIVATAFANVFDGVSYVEPFAVHWDFYGGMPAARRLAEQQFGGATILQCNGAGWDAAVPNCPNYMTSMWRRTGFTDEEMRTLPLVIDRRDAGREAGLVKQHQQFNRLPMLLVNFSGITSPFPAAAEVMNLILSYRNKFNVVNLANIRAVRIYDLLGLYDAAVGMITSDTATLHLAPASGIPYVAYTANDGSSSVPKGNYLVEIKYRDGVKRLDEVKAIVEDWSNMERPMAALGRGGGGGVLAV